VDDLALHRLLDRVMDYRTWELRSFDRLSLTTVNFTRPGESEQCVKAASAIESTS
jgi:hypothetical protein